MMIVIYHYGPFLLISLVLLHFLHHNDPDLNVDTLRIFCQCGAYRMMFMKLFANGSFHNIDVCFCLSRYLFAGAI